MATESELLDLIAEVIGRIVIEVGQNMNPQIVADLDMRPIQEAAERHVDRMLDAERWGLD